MQGITISNKASVAVVMATYNGSNFLIEQIESILNQTLNNIDVNIYISDDLSTDHTWSILCDYQQRFSNIKCVKNDSTHGPAGNFINALRITQDEQFYIFSDQDDVWFHTKIDHLCEVAKLQLDLTKPGLVYCNAEVNNKKLTVKFKDLYNGKYKVINSFNDLLFLNGGVQGASMIINHQMKKSILEYNKNVFMHDQLATYLAVLNKNIFYTPKVLMHYRQHESNVIGSNVSLKSKIKILASTPLINPKSCKFISEFCELYHYQLSSIDYNSLMLVSNTGVSTLRLLIFVLRNGVQLNGSRLILIVKIILKCFVRKTY